MADRREHGMGIFGRMLLVMLAVASIPMGLLWYASYREESAQVTSSIDARLTSTADRLAQYTDNWLDTHARMLRMVAQNPDMVSMEGAKQKPLLTGIIDQYPYIYLAHTLRLDGTNEGRSDGKPPLYYGDRRYVKETLGSKAIGFESAIGKTSGLPAFMIAVPILRDGKPVGVLSAAHLINDISKQIVDASIGKTGFAFLVDQSGRVVAHPDQAFAREQKDLSQHPAFLAFKNEHTGPMQIDVDGKRVLAVAVGIREGMVLIVQQDAAEAYYPLEVANVRAAKLLVGSLVLVVLLAFAFSRGLTGPIRRLTRAAEAMSLGEMNTDIPEVARGDELGGLARAIDRMGVSLKLAMASFESSAAPPVNNTTSNRPPPRNSMIVERPEGGLASPTEKTGS